MTERQGRVLSELCDMGLELTRKLHRMAMDCEDAEEAQRLAAAFHRLSRSVRQTLALEAQLERQARRDLLEAEHRAEAARARRLEQRTDQADARLTRLIWTEADPAEAYQLHRLMGVLLADEAAQDRFLEGPLTAVIDRIREDLGLGCEAEDDEDLEPPPLGDREAAAGARPPPRQPDLHSSA
ncbi:MAG: hypothetical protein ACK4YQ_14490 [Phenylobacterium sp.]|uniref:hypothetical protein n=1 Tax=Phenylobacterium sp. TaxID=1871053 RepID=UPI00391BD4F8